MSLTLDVARELCAVRATKAAEQSAELASMIRFGGVLDVSPNVAGESADYGEGPHHRGG